MYRVTLKGDIVASNARATILHGGVLEMSDASGGIDLFLAPGQWEAVYWDGEEGDVPTAK